MDCLKYYSKLDVQKEIIAFLKDRWVAIHCTKTLKNGSPVLLRYYKGKPLVITSTRDLLFFMKKFKFLQPRTFYGSASLYLKLKEKDDALNYIDNIYARTPTWDVDSRLEWWKTTLKVARVIVDYLEKEGVYRSVYLKWSGRGLHVHIHEKAFSKEVYDKIHPIDLSYSIVEYVLKKIREKVFTINKEDNVSIKVENLMDPQRVFTAPLSLHRFLDISCIAFRPEEIDSFDVSWLSPTSPRHNPDWKKYIEGEADALAYKAYKVIGAYPKPSPPRRFRKLPPVDEQIKRVLEQYPKTSVSLLRYNLNPRELKKRDLRGDSKKAVEFLEDILSHYIQGKISFEEARNLIVHYRDIVIPSLDYIPEVKENIRGLFHEVLNIISKLRSPSKVKEWLLSHGPPRSVDLKHFIEGCDEGVY
ncbi:MAG: hypothetical protein J7L38_06945 [Thermoproteales archaeon]|nr:hypothetical protein [Thermoproteales archaeon]